MAERLYTMKDVVDLTGIPATTLRFYDKKGMLAFVKRSVSGVRIFTDRDVAILRMIQFLRNIDMPIRDITHFITLYQEEKQEQVKAASYIDKLLKGKLDAGFTDNDLPLTLTKKDIPPELQDFFSHRDR